MGTTIRAELKESNKYWISPHRYYELKHFCLQYPGWKKMLNHIDGYTKNKTDISNLGKKLSVSKPTERAVEEREYYSYRIEMIERIAKDTDNIIGNYILKGVTEGISYDIIKARIDIPCCKELYYKLYRKFFWLLDKARA